MSMLLIAILASCVSRLPTQHATKPIPPAAPGAVYHTSPSDWGQDTGIAVIGNDPAIGEEWLAITTPYGESVLVWSFEGLKRQTQYDIVIPVMIDTRENRSWVEIAVVAGIVSKTDCLWPRETICSGIQATWNPYGGGTETGRGNATMGALDLHLTNQSSSTEGIITVVLVTGHWSRVPAEVKQYIGSIQIKPSESKITRASS